MNYDFKTVEPEIMEYWNKNNIYAKAKELSDKRGKGKKRFYFLQGPPYTSGKFHLGHAWNHALKDMILRYKRMSGLAVWDRNGYDMHGLPTAHATQKELGLESKEDIIKYGMEKFITACKNLCLKNMHTMNNDLKRMGVWMDHDNAYMPITNEYIEGEWWLVKEAHKKNRLYEGLKTMTWCKSCATALAKHECEYEEVTDKSIFVKFAVKGEDNQFLLIWTTTPWTIPFNLGIMVNPELDYLKVKVKNVKQADGCTKDEVWFIAKALAGAVINGVADYEFEVLEEFKGDKLEGTQYIHPFNKFYKHYEELELEHPKVHSVVMSKEYVNTQAGTGLVHCAPGCGPEDYEVGVQNGLPAFNNIDEYGKFPKDMNQFAGKIAKKDDKFFIEELDKLGVLVASTPVEHDYAHCWRCKNPVVFRTTKQWFFKVEDMKQKLIDENNKIYWVPTAAYNAFDSWLNNLRDNSISKQRYWGTPIPIWKCDSCENYEVIGNTNELKEKAGSIPDDLHIPWIDKVTWKCSCGGTKKRIPDILDVWVDAGCAAWNCLDFPKNKELLKELFPADFILEGKDQIRGWFNLLHIASMIGFDKPSFKACYMHGFINDSKGRKMSKSLKNYILPNEVIDKYGSDTLRYYTVGAANPAVDMNYNFDDVELKFRNLFVFWNLGKFIIDLKNNNNLELKEPKSYGIEEEYMLSKLNSTIKLVTEKFDKYLLNEIPSLIDNCLLDLSRTYIQLVRDKASIGTQEEKEAVLYVAYTSYMKLITMFSTLAPYFTEKIYLNMKEHFDLKEESIHFSEWPTYDEKLINEELEAKMSLTQNVISAGLAAREKISLGVRWPLSKLRVESEGEVINELVLQQLNIKNIEFGKVKVAYNIKPNYRDLGKVFGQETPDVIEIIKKNENKIAEILANNDKFELEGKEFTKNMFELTIKAPEGTAVAEFNNGLVSLTTELTEELEAEGFMRELTRRVQQMRKEDGLTKTDRIILGISGEKTLLTRIAEFNEYFQEKVGASKLLFAEQIPEFKNTKKLKIKGKEFSIGFELEGNA